MGGMREREKSNLTENNLFKYHFTHHKFHCPVVFRIIAYGQNFVAV
jgi:hypothetical protein